MANNPQARKRVRQAERRTELNRTLRSRMRTEIKKLEVAIEAGNKEVIGKQFPITMSQLHKAVSKGLLKKETASRKVSRLAARVKAQAAASA